MFKSKKSLYILLPINLLVWGFIGYKIISVMQGDEPPVVNQPVEGPTVIGENDTVTYQLTLNYEDPFLKAEPAKRNGNSEQRPSPITKPLAQTVKQKPELKTNDIRYLGIVQNKTSGITMAMISVNGNSHVIKKGDIVDGISIKNISPDVLEVKDGKQLLRIGK